MRNHFDDVLRRDIAIRSPEVNQKLVAMGLEPTGTSAAELARIHRADYEKWGPVIKASGFKPGG